MENAQRVTQEQSGFERVYDTFFEAGEVVEIRALGVTGTNRAWEGYARGTVAGYFDNAIDFARAARVMDQVRPEGIYFTLNPANRALLARAANRLKTLKTTTADADVTCLRWLYIDFDPVRPSGISSTDAELNSARELSEKVCAWLLGQGMQGVLRAESGNGCHLHVRLPDLTNVPEHVALVKGMLLSMSQDFSTDEVKIDEGVYNPARIARLYGTVTRKGDSTPERPHRVSVLYPADRPGPVPHEKLLALAGTTQRTKKVVPIKERGERFDVGAFLTGHGVQYREKPHEIGTLYCLDECVFDPSHGPNEASVIQFHDGNVGYQCFHDHCKGKTWREAEERIGAMNGPRDIDPPAAPSAWSRKFGETHPTSKEILRALKENQDGDARLFVQLHEDRYAYDHSEQAWYRFDGSHWKKDTTGLATAAITDVIDAYAAEAGNQHRLRLAAEKQGIEEEAKRRKAIGEGLHERIYKLQGLMRKKQVLALAAVDWAPRGKSLALEGTEWDADPMLLGCKNGVIDLRNGTFRAGRPGDYIKTYSPTEWRGLDAPAPGWERFLLEVFDHDKDTVDYIQRLSGYAITGQTSEHIYPILCGPGRNGKGTFLEVQKEVLGNLAGTIDAETILSQPWGKQAGAPSSEIMYMRGKRLLWSSETDEGRSFATGKLKWLTGGDTLTARPVYGKEQIDFSPSHTLFLITNHRPHASSEDRALWERVHFIDFKLSFVDDPKEPEDRQRDAKLPKKLKKEKAGILAWMVRGCLLWQQHGLKPPDSVKAATENYRKEEDLLGHFLSECCVLGENTEVQAGKLYHAYEDWCRRNKLTAITGTAFGLQMKKRFDACKSAHGIMYRGCGLLDQIHEGL